MNIEQPQQLQFETEEPQDPVKSVNKAGHVFEESKNTRQGRGSASSDECVKEEREEPQDLNRMDEEDDAEGEAQASEDEGNEEAGNEPKMIEEQGTVETKDKKKRGKKIKNLKCSSCLKKRSGKEVILCKTCPKMFHMECLNIDPQKVPRKFQCDKCRIYLKEKEHKKKIKAAKLHEKIAIKMNSESKKTQKQLIELMRKLPPSVETDKDKEMILQQFQLKYPYYVSKSKIVFPIEDDLFDQYSSILPKNAVLVKPEPTAKISKNFGTLLQLWNCLQTFPQYFEEQHKLSVSDLQATLEQPKNLIFVQNLYLHLLHFFLMDIFNEKFEMNRHLTSNSFLALLRYCSENNAFDRIFRFVWVQFIEQISRLPDYEIMFKRNSRLISIISRLRDKENEIWMPSNIDDRYYIIKALLSGVVDTSSFHELLYEKIEQGRQNTRQKNEYQENLKNEESNIQIIKQSIRSSQKQLKQKQKALDQAGERSNKPKLEKEVQRVTQVLEKLIEEREQSAKNIEMFKQSLEYASNSTTHTSVWLVGQDKQRRSYWFLLDQRDKLFVSTSDEHWSYYDYYKINNELIKCLNLKGLRQKNLYDTLVSYRKSNYFIHSQNKQVPNLESALKSEENHQKQINEYNECKVFDFDKEKVISFKFIKSMLIEGERKIYAYLEERNARWSTPQDRGIYLDSIHSANKNEEIMDAVRYLNEKICVVEIEYKFVVEDDKEEGAIYDSKTRKIQTKMWGINEKYKHAWLDYGRNAKNLLELFFLVAILYLTIERYVKKMRETRKIKKQVEQVRVLKRNKLLNKTDGQGKELDASQWDELCGCCKKWGDLLCCDTCPKVFHLECIGLREVPEGEFKCRQCEEKRQTRSRTKKNPRTS